MVEEIDCSKMNLLSGEIKESKSDLENLKDFIRRWEGIIKEIKQICLDNTSSYNLAGDYLNELDKFMMAGPKNRATLLNQLVHDLFLAITQANNNYKQKFPSFWNNFSKLKIGKLLLERIPK